MHDVPNEMKNSTPKISIGLVVYNGIEHIRSALDSIVRLSYGNIELIVVDGGSKDGTQDVLKEYAEHISVLVSEPDKGIYDAMNKVCSLATGDWLIFLGCDDVLLDTLGNITRLMTDPGAVYYGDVIFRSGGKIYGGKFSKFRLLKHNICHQALFYPRSVYSNYSYSLDYRLQADYAYNLSLLGLGIKFIYTGVVISLFNDGGASFSSDDVDFRRDRFRLITSSLGPVYALLEIVLMLIKYPIKLLVPTPVWKYCQSLYRKNR
ncbi:MAG: glycosyltransferase family 2 protein [Gallionella sp.]